MIHAEKFGSFRDISYLCQQIYNKHDVERFYAAEGRAQACLGYAEAITRVMGKRYFVLAVATMMATVGILAQEGYEDIKHEVAISFGGYNNSIWINGFSDIGIECLETTNYYRENVRFLGSFSAEYFYHVKPWLAVGGVVSYSQHREDIFFPTEGNNPNNVVGGTKNYFVTLMPAMKYDWYRRKKFGMYSKLALGATLRREKSELYVLSQDNLSRTQILLNWQLSYFGLEVGSHKFRFFNEYGMGEQGIIILGLRYRFQ